MRRIALSGGLELGPKGGPWIDIVPFPPGRRVELAEAEALARDPASVWMRLPRRLPVMPGGVGIVGANADHTLLIRFLRPRQMNDVEALRHIVAHEPELSPAIVGAVLAASTGLSHAQGVPGLGVALVATACATTPRPEGSRPESDRTSAEIQALADRYVEALLSGGTVDVPVGRVARARYWLAVGRRLWRPEVLARLGRSDGVPFGALFMAGQLAAAHMLLHDVDTLPLPGGVLVRLGEDVQTRVTAWPQALELAAGGIGQEALNWLCGGRLDTTAAPTLDRAFHTEADIPPTPDPELALALARQFLADAEAHGVYTPAGAFEVDIPQGLHLAGWGVKRLKVWCEADCLWVGVVGEEGLGCMFQWRPRPGDFHPHSGGLRPWVVAEPAGPMVHATLAALWHDLRVAGEDAAPMVRAPASRSRRREPGEGRAVSRRSLPGRRHVWLRGRRQWGSAQEREHIVRRAHGVRGHLRRLPLGWHRSAEAEAQAGEWGITLPPGYTFVRPHVRGGEADTGGVEAVVRVHARGLLTLTALLQ
ncbi:MAG: hypothetical protein KatS3mg050_1840 [Litorilinea sp.]|nr:MAG: hypothetical protein KatS3mg050_1840 [Litorilinea sp.]